MKKVNRLFVAALMALASLLPVQAEEVVVADGHHYSSQFPVVMRYYNQNTIKNFTQMIYPASMLNELNGKKINSMKFFVNEPFQKIYGGNIQLSLKVVEDNEFNPDAADPSFKGMTVVAQGAPVRGETELVFNFTEPFEYNGGNLAVEARVTEKGESHPDGIEEFIGMNIYDENGVYGLDVCYYCVQISNSYLYHDFWFMLPKAAFGIAEDAPQYDLGDVDHDGKVTIADVTALIDYLLSGEEAPAEANVDGDQNVSISDVTALIDMLLGGTNN